MVEGLNRKSNALIIDDFPALLAPTNKDRLCERSEPQSILIRSAILTFGIEKAEHDNSAFL